MNVNSGKFNVDAIDGGAYSEKDITIESDDHQLVNYGSLKSQGEARYEYMFQVLCNTLGLNYTSMEEQYDQNAGYYGAGSESDDHFNGINPQYSSVGPAGSLDPDEAARVNHIDVD